MMMMRTGFANHRVVSNAPRSGEAFLSAMPLGNEIIVRIESGSGVASAWFTKGQARELSDLFADLVDEDTFGWSPGG